jgi:hypothetical protein
MPKNEYDMYSQLRHWAGGVEVIRIENIGLPLPDQIWLFRGVHVWHEAKILRRNRIQIRVNAHAQMMRMRHKLKDWMLNYTVWDEESASYNVYWFEDVVKTGVIETSSRPGIGWIPLLGIKYRHKFSSKEECNQYIEDILDLAYPARVKNREKLKQQAESSINGIRFE